MRRILSLSGQLALAIVAMFVCLRLWAFIMYPIGGGEYHAIFAYSDTGRLGTALTVYALYLASLLTTAIALRLVGLSLTWWQVALVASAVGMYSWISIATWESRTTDFGRAALTLLVALPAIAGVAVWLGYAKLGITPRPRGGRLIGTCILIVPFVWASVILSTPLRERFARASWMPSTWESPAGAERVGEFIPEQGVVFEAERARELVRQCTRPTPGAIVGTWTPSSQQIAILEDDLARYLVRHDTARTRANGFVMPPFHVYYRQYGGLSLAGEGEIIYVNALLPGYFTNENESGSPAAWRRETISVCGGWQAYFGVEYSPKTRQFRRFSYNPSPT